MNKQFAKRHPNKRKRIPVVLIAATVLLLLLVISASAGLVFLRVHRPSVDTDVPFSTDNEPSGSDTTAPPASGDGTTGPDDTTAKTDTFVRDTEIVNFLLLGQDAASANTDVIMLINFNMREGSLAVLQIPRDTYIEIDQVRGRINTSLSTMRKAAYNADRTLSTSARLKAGMQGVVELLEKSLCIQIDGYAHVNLEGFRAIIDAMGGVRMDVPFEMKYSDPDQNLEINLKPGVQILSGAKAEMFVRFRSGFVQADIGRIDAQKLFLTALFKQVKSSLTPATVSKIAEQVFKYITTDIPLADIVIYAKELLGVDMAKVSMMTLHGSSHQTANGAWYYVMNRAAALSMINSHFNVYSQPISDTLFDRTCAFTDENYAPFRKIYEAAADDDIVQVKPEISTGEEIDRDGLDIPLN